MFDMYVCHGRKRYLTLNTNERLNIARSAMPPSFYRYLHMTYTNENFDVQCVLYCRALISSHRVDIYVLLKL